MVHIYPNETVPKEFRDWIKFELREVYLASRVNFDNKPDFNPVKKVPVIISGDEGTVFIEVVDELLRAEFGKISVAGSVSRAGIGEQLLALQSGMLQICHSIQGIKMKQGLDRANILKQ